MNADWLIVGAGVGGLTLATKLAEHGQSCALFEREQDGTESGAGLLLAPNAARVLQRLRLLEEATKAGHRTNVWHLRSQSGALLREIRVETEGLPALSVHRADLLRLLRSRLPRGSLRTGAEIAGVYCSRDRAELRMTDGSTATGKGVIGADGIRSTVRGLVFGQRKLRYRGYVGWRGIARYVPKGYADSVLSETWGVGGRFGIAAVGSGRTYWYASANQEEEWVDEAGPRQSNLLRRFRNWHSPVCELIAATFSEDILVSRIYDAPKTSAWSKGNVTLLGDAAHAMTPNLGQGACLAMEDAFVLGQIISREPDAVRAFGMYERARMQRAYSIQKQSRAMGWAVQASSGWAVALRDWLTPRVPERILRLGMSQIFADQLI